MAFYRFVGHPGNYNKLFNRWRLEEVSKLIRVLVGVGVHGRGPMTVGERGVEREGEKVSTGDLRHAENANLANYYFFALNLTSLNISLLICKLTIVILRLQSCS